MEQVATGQLPRRLQLLPAYGTVVRVLLQVLLTGQRITLLHVVEYPQVVAVSLELALNLVHQETQLHDDHQAGHG